MATQLFLLDSVADTHLGTDNTNVLGTAVGWTSKALGTARGSGVIASDNVATVTGATTGITITKTSAVEWISPPVAADVTISGTITGNIWASESNMSANVAINVIVDIVRANATATRNSNTIVQIVKSTFATEVAVTTRAANNFTSGMTSGYSAQTLNRGDRLRVRVFGDDSGTMATGYTFNASWGGTSAAADGDSYVSFTENFSFESAPGGSVVYLTATASAVSTASDDREAWTSRGSAATNKSTNTATGWTAPIQVGGTPVDWFTRPLTAFTLTGMAVANLRLIESDAAANASFRCEIARVAGDGTSPTVWASWCIAPTGTDNGEVTDIETARTAYVSGDDLAITNGQRLRIRLYVEDSSSVALVTGHLATVYYSGTSAAASGDTYITFPQTLTEYASGPFTYTKAGYGKESG